MSNIHLIFYNYKIKLWFFWLGGGSEPLDHSPAPYMRVLAVLRHIGQTRSSNQNAVFAETVGFHVVLVIEVQMTDVTLVPGHLAALFSGVPAQ